MLYTGEVYTAANQVKRGEDGFNDLIVGGRTYVGASHVAKDRVILSGPVNADTPANSCVAVATHTTLPLNTQTKNNIGGTLTTCCFKR